MHSAFYKSEEDDSWNWKFAAVGVGGGTIAIAAAPAVLAAAGFTSAGRTLFSDQFLLSNFTPFVNPLKNNICYNIFLNKIYH